MNILAELRNRFREPLSKLVPDPKPALEMIRPAQDAKFGDYQANCAMPLGKQLGKSPREIAQQLADAVDLSDLCDKVEIAGPGFINLKLKDSWLSQQLETAFTDERLGVDKAAAPKTYVVDYSSPNVAKAMHVGHIRSTVIGDALCRVLRFLGHNVISDNHLGDWGTQFGMIIYGYKHFVDKGAFAKNPVGELNRLYRLVRSLTGYFENKAALGPLKEEAQKREQAVATAAAVKPTGDKAADKKAAQAVERAKKQLADKREELKDLEEKIAKFESSPAQMKLASEHAGIENAVLAETAKLHADDAENLKLWQEFLPHCRVDIQRIYDRLDIKFDHELGESFYHHQLADVVAEFEKRGFARESDGAMCVFLDGFDAPMIIRKKDGAFLYSTTDLATIAYRMKNWKPDAILYVVDFRQGEHFDKLFAAAKLWGCENVEFRHVSFGTVMGNDGKPFKTRDGDTVGLEGLLDDAEANAYRVVSEKDSSSTLSEPERKEVGRVVGLGAIKYSDLSHHRTSDYVFSYDKMLALEGNTATYMQYCYARRNGIFRRGNVDISALRASKEPIQLGEPAERALALQILRFSEALNEVPSDYCPNLLTNYLYDLAKTFTDFFEKCSVLKAETESLKTSRLKLCDLSARTIQKGLELLGG
jgi:arginyl-tRNA synthetase